MRGLIFSLALAGTVFASDDPCKIKPFFKDREKGWFWKKMCIGREEKELRKTKVIVPWDRIDKIKPSELRKIYTEALDVAIANPTYENVREVKRLEMYMTKKARKYQEVASLVVMTDPELAAYTGMIASQTPARIAYMETKQEEIYRKLVRYRQKAGLIVAVRKGCSYCRAFKQMVATYFIPRTGWSVKYVDIDENPNFARNMSVYAVPDVFLAIKEEKPFIVRIATGYVSFNELIGRIYTGIKVYEQGGLSYGEVARHINSSEHQFWRGN